MKTLYLIRHAKASGDYGTFDDYNRTLSDRGKNDIKLIGKELKKRDIKLDKIYCSAAKRTTKTCKKLCKEIDYDFDKVKFDRELYDNNSGALDYFISYVMELDKKYDKVAIVGHNYILSEFASFLIGEDIRLPTSGVIKIDFGLKKWKDISYQSGKLDYFIYPSLIRK